MNLVTAATDFEGQLACQTFFRDQIRNLHCPFFGFSPARKEIVVLKQKDRNASILMKIEHLVDDRAWCAQTTQWTTLLFIKRSNTAERTIPRTPATAENRRRRHGMTFVVNRFAIGPRKQIQIFDHCCEWRHSDCAVIFAKCDAGKTTPLCVRRQTIQKLHERHFTIESHHRVETFNASENLVRFETGVVTTHREVSGYASLAQCFDHLAEVRCHVLKDQ